jgi:hypothetical protein
MPKTRTEFFDFRGGWIKDLAPDLMPNALQIADNIDLSENGGALQRYGTLPVNLTPYGANVTQMIRWPRNSGVVTRLAVVGGNLCKVAEDGSLTVIHEVKSQKIGYYFHQDVMYFVDGDNYYWYNGTICRPVQQPALAAPAIEESVQNPFTGVYKGFFTIQYWDGQNGMITRSSYVFTLDLGSTIYSSIKWELPTITYDYSETSWVRPEMTLYRTVSNGSEFKRVATVENGSTFIDSVPDASLGDGVSGYVSYYAAPTASGYNSQGTVTHSGVYLAKVVFLDEIGNESLPSESVSVMVNSSAIHWTNIPLGPEGTTTRRLYRTVANGTTFYRVTEIPDNTTTTYFDTMLDDDLKKNATLITDNNLKTIKKCKCLGRHPQSYRIFANGDGTTNTYFSEPSNPAYFKETSIMVPTTGDGPAKGLGLFMDAIVIFFENSNWVWQGIDPNTDVTWNKLATPDGSRAPWSMQLTPNSMTYIGESGPVVISAGVLGTSSTVVVGEQAIRNVAECKLASVFRDLANKEDSVAIYNTTKQMYLFAVNGTLYAFYWPLGAFSRWPGINVNDILYNPDGEVWIATANYILKMTPNVKSDFQSDGTTKPIAFKFRTPDLSLNAPFNRKRFERLIISYQDPGISGYSFTVKVFVDGVEVVNKVYTPTGGTGSKQAIIGVWRYGRRISVEISDELIDTATVIYGVAFDIEFIQNSYGSEV